MSWYIKKFKFVLFISHRSSIFKLRNDWKYVAMVIDRLLLYTFFGITLGGTLGILLSSPYVFDTVDQKEQIALIKTIYSKNIH